jgi:hypothetical protein
MWAIKTSPGGMRTVNIVMPIRYRLDERAIAISISPSQTEGLQASNRSLPARRE